MDPLPQDNAKLEQPPSEIEQWTARYESILGGLDDQSMTDEDADRFYEELNVRLREKYKQIRIALTGLDRGQLKQRKPSQKKAAVESPDEDRTGKDAAETPLPTRPEPAPGSTHLIHQLAELSVLYKLRIQALHQLSPSLRKRVTGTGIEGVQSCKEELAYLFATMHVYISLLPQKAIQLISDIVHAPVPLVWLVFKLALVLVVFILWRRWATREISTIRDNLSSVKEPTWVTRGWAKIFWYLLRVRNPLEWGIVFWILFSVIISAEDQTILTALWEKINWVLAIWFIAALAGAVSIRGRQSRASNSVNLRLRSIRIIALWSLIASLGLSTIEDFVGKGTAYAWYGIICQVLLLIVFFRLYGWWRKEIERRLSELPQQPAYIQKLLGRNKGVVRYLGTGIGAAYLAVNSLRRLVLKWVNAFEGGRYFVANLTRLEAMRVSERMPQILEGEPISNEMRTRFFEDQSGLVETVGQVALDRMISLVETGRRGGAIVVAEQGGGLTHLFKRLKSSLGEQMLIFECPPGGIGPFQDGFAALFDLKPSDLTPAAISAKMTERKIKVFAIDNLHRLSRPALGGQRDVEKVAELLAPAQNDVFWFFGVSWAGWHYISRVRADRMFLDDVVRLPLWSEEHIREMIELRSANIGINPGFGELDLPHQFDDMDFETEEERNRFGFFRILWNASDGNPMVSLQLWADALRIHTDGRIRVSIPQLPAISELDSVDMNMLLILRVVAQSEWATREEIVDSLQFPVNEVTGALGLATARGWLESEDGRFRITWKWFRSITRVLARKNLLVRTTLGV